MAKKNKVSVRKKLKTAKIRLAGRKKGLSKSKRVKKNSVGGKAVFRTSPSGKRIVVAVSGGFDPVHVGHIRMFEAAKRLGTELVVILNNDHWLKAKKGYIFMPESERCELISSLRSVDRVFISEHKPDDEDKSVCRELKKVRPNVFANGGDRTQDNIPEVEVCREIGCAMIFGVGRGGKVQSSSWLLEKFRNGN